MDSPNILMIMVDQLTATALSGYGNSVAKTPHIDKLVEQGLVFENAYCNSPLCAPSRFSMLSGQLPSRIAAYDNAAHFPADVPTFAHYLRQTGYSTCLSGKMHFVGPDQLHGFEERITTDIYPSDYGWTPDWENFEIRPSWYHNMLSVVQAGICVTSNQLDFDNEVAYHSVKHIYNLARSDDKRPFFLLSSFTHPHDPYTITEEYWNRYEHSEIDMPKIPALPYEELDAHSQRLYHVCAMNEYAQTEERVRNARHAYYGMISYIDDKVGELLNALAATGLDDNTVIVFVSDHGEMLGERGMWYKMSFFEGSTRVPMIFYAPQHFKSGRIATPVSLLDLLPTLTDIAHNGNKIDFVSPLDGRTLLPALTGRVLSDEFSVYGEMLGEGAIAPLYMIRRGAYKYIYSKPDPAQLYNLENDPQEEHSLIGQAEFQSIHEAFQNELETQWDNDNLHQAIIMNQHRRHMLNQSLKQGKFTAWDYQPTEDASQKYMRNHLDLNILERTARYPSPDIPPHDG